MKMSNKVWQGLAKATKYRTTSKQVLQFKHHYVLFTDALPKLPTTRRQSGHLSGFRQHYMFKNLPARESYADAIRLGYY